MRRHSRLKAPAPTSPRDQGIDMSKIRNLKLSHKLILLFLFMALLTGATGVFGIWSINKVGGKIQGMLKARAAQEKLVVLMKVNLQECRVTLLEAAMAGSTDDLDLSQGDYEAKLDFFKSYCDIMLKGNQKLGIPAAQTGSELEQRVQALQTSLAAFETVGKTIVGRKAELLKGGAGAASVGDAQLSRLTRTDLMESTDKTRGAVDDLLVTVGHLMTEANNEASMIKRGASVAFTAVIIGALILAILLASLSTRYLVKRINAIAASLSKGAEGDLTSQVSIDSGDELGTLGNDFNSMAFRLSAMIGRIKKSIGELGGISETISNTSESVVNAAELQATGVDTTSDALVEIDSSIKGVAEGVDSLSLSASETSSSSLEMAASIEEVALHAENLAFTVDNVSTSITEMAASIRQIDGSVAQLVEASNVTASSIAEMSCSIQQVEQSATDTASISVKVLHGAEEGKTAVEATIAGMEEIRKASSITSEVISTLSDRVTNIGTILSVIDEVTGQTNLLALNAAIIAAQAGEHGKGFMVVADEIKDLAERTSSSTQEIAAVIKGVQQETARAVEAIRLAEGKIVEGESLSRKSGDALVNIVEEVKKAGTRIDEIARATVEQAKGSQLIRETMEQVSEMVAQIARATGEQGKGSELIMVAVEKMKDMTTQVRQSTQEQSKVSGAIAKATENITEMIKKIKQACDEQSRESERIVDAVTDIRQSSGTNLGATRVMNESVIGLSTQIRILENEITGFSIQDA